MHDDFWRSRGYLPHYDEPGTVQFVTFRLFDSVPAEVIQGRKAELNMTGRESGMNPKLLALLRRIAAYEDAGHGACHLSDARIAGIVQNALHHFDEERYRLLAWCIMPNHVHALIESSEDHPLDRVLYSWKSFTAKAANRLLGRTGPFWMKEYYDRYMRDATHMAHTIHYIEENPVKAGLVGTAEEWQWSSARYRINSDE